MIIVNCHSFSGLSQRVLSYRSSSQWSVLSVLVMRGEGPQYCLLLEWLQLSRRIDFNTHITRGYNPMQLAVICRNLTAVQVAPLHAAILRHVFL